MLSTCPKCETQVFEVKMVEPIGSNYKLYFIQCAQCGTPVGTAEYNNVGAMLAKQNEAIKKIAKALNVSVDL